MIYEFMAQYPPSCAVDQGLVVWPLCFLNGDRLKPLVSSRCELTEPLGVCLLQPGAPVTAH